MRLGSSSDADGCPGSGAAAVTGSIGKCFQDAAESVQAASDREREMGSSPAISDRVLIHDHCAPLRDSRLRKVQRR
jgi:hypothetical protein